MYCDQCGFLCEGHEGDLCPSCGKSCLLPVRNEQEAAILQKGYFLRNDLEIRQAAGMIPKQAYSLCQKNPFKRIYVFAGNKDWAIEQAHKMVMYG